MNSYSYTAILAIVVAVVVVVLVLVRAGMTMIQEQQIAPFSQPEPSTEMCCGPVSAK